MPTYRKSTERRGKSIEGDEDDDDDEEDGEGGGRRRGGLSQNAKENLGVCVVILAITLLAVVVTLLKIFLVDIETYPELFGKGDEKEGVDEEDMEEGGATISPKSAAF